MSPTPAVVEDVVKEKVDKLVLPPMVTPARPPNVQVVCIGAGGTGGRVLGPLIKMLRQGDRLDVVDHDQVETRNLLRQHFTLSHVGRNKAEVAVGRLRGEASRVGVTLQAWPSQADATSLRGIFQEGRAFAGHILLGCVDNREARAIMRDTCLAQDGGIAWIDAGNEVSGGQVVLSLFGWPVWGIDQGAKQLAKTSRETLRTQWEPEHYFTVDTVPVVVPQLVQGKLRTPAEVAAEACAVRMDTQTVAANQMAAALMVNMIGWLLDEVPFCNVGAFFHTICTIKPVVLTSVTRAGGTWAGVVKPV